MAGEALAKTMSEELVGVIIFSTVDQQTTNPLPRSHWSRAACLNSEVQHRYAMYWETPGYSNATRSVRSTEGLQLMAWFRRVPSDWMGVPKAMASGLVRTE